MISKSRRNFLRDTSLTATGLFFIAPLTAKKAAAANRTAIGCAPAISNAISSTVTSIKSGNWSDPATWNGKLPNSADIPQISAGHTVIYDVTDSTVSGLVISSGGTLKFDAAKKTVLYSSGNVVVEGLLHMHPASSNVIHCLQFINVKEDNFIGGGHNVLSSDVGLWIMNSGCIDILGSYKTSWTNTTGPADKNSTSFVVKDATGWNAGDEIVIFPTRRKDLTGFEERTITAINGNTISFDKPLLFDHPAIKHWTPEVGNLTRNARIEGTANGRPHVFIKSAKPQTIKNVSLRYLGPRKDFESPGAPGKLDGIKEMVPGRYALHFHHSEDGSRGSVVEGCVVREAGNHSYVPHVSHGITFKKNIAFNVIETAFWWDPGHVTHDSTWDGNLVGLVKFVRGSTNVMDPNPSGKAPMMSVSGFTLGVGDNNICVNNVCAGTSGLITSSGGFDWMADNEGVWPVFKNNLSHNCHNGLFVWQVTHKQHTIQDYSSYNNDAGLFHGAYVNSYRYFGGTHFGNPLIVKAGSSSRARLRFENMEVDVDNNADYCIEVPGAQIAGTLPVLFRNVIMKNYRKAPLILASNMMDEATKKIPLIKNVDIVDCDMGSVEPVVDAISHAAEKIRVQPINGASYELTKSSRIAIQDFASKLWGIGMGLGGDYYKSVDFTNNVFSRVDPWLSFDAWYDSRLNILSVDYRLGQVRNFSVKWQGFIEPQFTEEHTFTIKASGGYKLTIAGLSSQGSKQGTLKVNLIKGQAVPVEIQFKNYDTFMMAYAQSGASLLWNSASIDKFSPGGEYVPMSQLYSSVITTPLNRGPVANAGADSIITLPVNKVKLDGSASVDTDGSIDKFQWSRISGPGQYTIANSNNAVTDVTNLIEGTYVFRLTVTDNIGATAYDDVAITVKPAVQVAAFTVDASPNPTTNRFNIKVSTNSNDPISIKIYSRWGYLMETFTGLSNNSSLTVGNKYEKGTYYLNATQGSVTKTLQLIKI